MANATFPIPLGRDGSSNARVLNALRSARIPYAASWPYWYQCRVQVGDFTGEADGDQTLDLNTLFPANAFPANVKRLCPYVLVGTGIGGGTISAADIEVGDAGDPNGLVIASSAFTGVAGLICTPAAAEYRPRTEATFAPTLRILTTGGNTNAITAMDLTVVIRFAPLPA
jgi:hypothetical protein